MDKENVIYIIGNGFDKHHELHTDYKDYKLYLKSKNPFLVERFDYYLNLKGFDENDICEWNELEVYLGYLTDFDYDEMIEDAFSNSEMDMDKAAYWDDPAYNVSIISEELINIIKGIKFYFSDWINKIEQDLFNIVSDKSLKFPLNSLFLSFNYTLTLERLYFIPSNRILHIHGKYGEDYILGHNNIKVFPFSHPNRMQMDNKGDVIYGDDYRIVKVKEKINDSYENIFDYYYKNSKQLITKNSIFFQQFEYANRIVFMGFSMGVVDIVYIEEISRKIRPCCDVYIYYYKKISDDIKNITKKYFNRNKIKFIKW